MRIRMRMILEIPTSAAFYTEKYAKRHSETYHCCIQHPGNPTRLHGHQETQHISWQSHVQLALCYRFSAAKVVSGQSSKQKPFRCMDRILGTRSRRSGLSPEISGNQRCLGKVE